jgi:hypothetical protein
MERETISLAILAIFIIFAFVITLIAAHRRDQSLIYVHTKTGNKYRIIQECLVKIDGTWVDGVIYINDHTGEMYVRSLIDFTKNFKTLAEWKEN